MKVLVVAPHMDDEALGVGGTIARHVKGGDDVHVCCVAHRVYNHQYDEKKNRVEIQCAQQAQAVLGYKELRFLNLPDERLDVCLQDIIIPLEGYLKEAQPEVVYINHRGDNNQDHRAVFQAAMVALRPASNPGIRRILCYETPSSTDQAPALPETAFLPNSYINIESYLEKKIAAWRCYQTEMRAFPHPRSELAVNLLAQRRGIESGFSAAEAFVVLRDRWL
ncbi:MAG: N-acetyl-alpha-D-glucosaminyl L-malate deacetylase 1 [Nitrosomonadaceae bacterium]|nr:N-acetyl-alpha-D-glucosaminyl L-malate deacetylase 1 [Nitrosomonadaceae bacterium]